MPHDQCYISVIIPTHNRSDALSLTLEHLSRQNIRDWEAIVVNNNCTDDTEQVLVEWRKRFPVPLQVVHEGIPGPGAARNAGAKAALGEFIVFIDNDILVKEDFLEQHLSTLREHPKTWFIGRVINPEDLRETPFGRYRDDLHEEAFVNLSDDGMVDYDGATGQNWAMRRDEFESVGGFDESFPIASCEDAELALRAREAGFRTMFNPHSVVVHNDWAIDVITFCHRQELYAIPSVLLWKRYGADSIQYELVNENGPINWKRDPVKKIVQKSAKWLGATVIPQPLTTKLCELTERLAPDSGMSRKAYRVATSLAIFRGVREGFRRYATNGERVES